MWIFIYLIYVNMVIWSYFCLYIPKTVMKKLKILFASLIFAFFAFSNFTAGPDYDDPAIGTWISEKGDSKVEIYKKDGLYYGKLVWADTEDNFIDVNNPDEALQNRNLIGSDLLSGFKYSGNAVYRSGKVYDPLRGKYYSCKITVVNNDTAYIRGYILFPALGRTEIAYRVKE